MWFVVNKLGLECFWEVTHGDNVIAQTNGLMSVLFFLFVLLHR